MIKNTNLIHGFLFLCFSLLQASEDNILVLQKRMFKDMITTCQINEEQKYLSKKLSLSRDDIEKKFDNYFKIYNDPISAESRYSEDLKTTENKIKQIINNITSFEQNNNPFQSIANLDTSSQVIEIEKILNEEKKGLSSLNQQILNLKIQQQLVESYKLSMHEEKLDNKIKENALKKVYLLSEALFLIATNTNDVEKNQQFYRKLSRHLHSDNLRDNNPCTQQEKNELFNNIKSLLSSSTSSTHLNNMIKAIDDKKEEIVKQINNPSLLKQALYTAVDFNCATTLPIISEGLGIALCNKIVTKIMPYSAGEIAAKNNCITNIRNSALQIETKLIKLSRYQ